MIETGELYDKKTVRELLSARGFRNSKAMGQSFLCDKNIPEKIVKLSGIDKSCGVIEVGPGLGALTLELERAAGHVLAVELDKRLIPVLHAIFAEYDNVSILQGDILKLDINKLLDGNKMHGLNHHVCANLPYNITTPAITAFIESDAFKTITVMVQKEVALRICAKPGSPEYGAFTVYANYHTKPEILFDVSPECFFPRPKVTSSVVKMEITAKRLPDAGHEEILFKVVRAAFGQRRKTLVNALHSVFGKTFGKEAITEIVTRCGYDAFIRGERLGVEDFVELSTHFR